jgi:LysM repeat protein
MNKYALPIITLTLSGQLSLFAGEVIVKPGETLSSLANYYNVSLESIIESNGLNDPDNLKAGQKLVIPNLRALGNEPLSIKHVIQKGETIESISILYKIKKGEIIRLNNLQKPYLIFEDQSILIPNLTSLVKKNNPKFHIIEEGDTLYRISKKYNVSLSHITKVNDIKNSNNLKIGLKLFLERNNFNKSLEKIVKGKEADWRDYGALRVNWSTWNKIENNSIALGLNSKGKPLYLAVNCYSSKLNWKTINGKWNQWFAPTNNFEFDLLDDLCENTSEV